MLPLLSLLPAAGKVVLPLLQNYWKPILIGCLALGAYLYVNNLKDTIADQQKEIGVLTVQRNELQASNDKLTASIAVTNKAIEEIRTLAPSTKKEFDTLSAKVSRQSDEIAAKIRRILEEKKPLTCEETIEYLIRAPKEFK